MSEPGFVVGGRYASAAGEYEVLAIEHGAVRLRYVNGFEMTLPAQGLWSQWQTLVQQRLGTSATASRAPAGDRQAAPRAPAARPAPSRGASAARASSKLKKPPAGDAGFFTAAGYLAGGCEITVSVAGRDYGAFAQRYKIQTGRSLVTPHEGLDIHERPTHRIGAELTVRFSATADTAAYIEAATGAMVEPSGGHGWYAITRTELVERLLKAGFDLGHNTDPTAIRERVPQSRRAAFDQGLALRRPAPR